LQGFWRFKSRGKVGERGQEQRSQQAQKQAHLFGLRSLWRRLRCWLAGHRLGGVVTPCIRRALALPVYAVALLLDYLAAALGRLAAWIADDD
jgi:putative lipase involved disintegration of autophagic bodies